AAVSSDQAGVPVVRQMTLRSVQHTRRLRRSERGRCPSRLRAFALPPSFGGKPALPKDGVETARHDDRSACNRPGIWKMAEDHIAGDGGPDKEHVVERLQRRGRCRGQRLYEQEVSK